MSEFIYMPEGSKFRCMSGINSDTVKDFPFEDDKLLDTLHNEGDYTYLTIILQSSKELIKVTRVGNKLHIERNVDGVTKPLTITIQFYCVFTYLNPVVLIDFISANK